MKRLRYWTLLLATFAAACPQVRSAKSLNDYDKRLEELRGSQDSSARTERAKIAADAVAAARAMRPSNAEQQKDQIAMYRAAAVASVEAYPGPAVVATLGTSTQEGEKACNALGAAASPPRDCTLLRLAFSLGVTKSLDDSASALAAKRDAARAAGTRLGPPDLADAHRIFGGYESEIGRVSNVSTTMPRQQLRPEFVTAVENDERALYCRLPPVIRSALAVDGQTQDTIKPLLDRKETVRRSLESRLGVIDCMNHGNAVALPQ